MTEFVERFGILSGGEVSPGDPSRGYALYDCTGSTNVRRFDVAADGTAIDVRTGEHAFTITGKGREVELPDGRKVAGGLPEPVAARKAVDPSVKLYGPTKRPTPVRRSPVDPMAARLYKTSQR